MKKRLDRLEKKQPALDPEKTLISYGQSWFNAIADNDSEGALRARQKAESYFDKLPQYRKKPPFCNKVLYIKWDWFVGWTNKATREFYKRCRKEGKSVNHIAQIENFNPKN